MLNHQRKNRLNRPNIEQCALFTSVKCSKYDLFFDFFALYYSVLLTAENQNWHFFSNCAYNTGHFIEFSSKKEFCSLICACISALFWLFCLIIQCVFTQKIPHFSSNCPNKTGHFIDFSPKKSDFFLKMQLYIELYFDFCAQ